MTVFLDQVEIRLTVEQVITAIKQLPPLDQALVRKALELGDEEWSQRFDQLLASVRTKVDADIQSTQPVQPVQPLTEDDITADVELVRAERDAQSRH